MSEITRYGALRARSDREPPACLGRSLESNLPQGSKSALGLQLPIFGEQSRPDAEVGDPKPTHDAIDLDSENGIATGG